MIEIERKIKKFRIIYYNFYGTKVFENISLLLIMVGKLTIFFIQYFKLNKNTYIANYAGQKYNMFLFIFIIKM